MPRITALLLNQEILDLARTTITTKPIKATRAGQRFSSAEISKCYKSIGLPTTIPEFAKPIRAMNRPIPAGIAHFKLVGRRWRCVFLLSNRQD